MFLDRFRGCVNTSNCLQFIYTSIHYLPAKQTKLRVSSILLEWNGEYMELGQFVISR